MSDPLEAFRRLADSISFAGNIKPQAATYEEAYGDDTEQDDGDDSDDGDDAKD